MHIHTLYICIYIYIHIHTHVCAHNYIYTCVCIYKYISTAAPNKISRVQGPNSPKTPGPLTQAQAKTLRK